MKTYLAIPVIVLTLFTVSCSGLSPTPIPAANSDDGKLYSKQCGSCHAVPHPKRLSFFGWKNLLPVMDTRMQERGIPKLNKTDKKIILRYLKIHSQ